MRPNWFVGAVVPARAWLERALQSMPASCRGFAPDDVHLTIAFLGAIDPGSAGRLSPILEQIDAAPFSITLGGLRALPSPRRVSALSLELGEGRKEAERLIAGWRGPLIDAVGARPDDRPPLPHITIARPIHRYGAEGRRAALAWADRFAPLNETLTVDRIALYTWSDDRRVRQFAIVEEHRLVGQS